MTTSTGTASGPYSWSSDRMPDLTGRTAVVTGASSGLGLQVTRALAQHGATVVMAVRDTGRGEDARLRLTGPGVRADQLQVERLDLMDLASVRAFAAELTGRLPALDLLVANGGISSQPHRLSPEGVESQMATNHLGHFALTGLLLRLLEGGQDPRVVTVASALYRGARLDPADLAGAAAYSPGRAYARSKLANVLFGRELERRLRAARSPVRSLLAHPGMAKTPLHDTYPSWGLRVATKAVAAFIARPAEQASGPLLFAATAPDADPGTFIGPTGSRRNPKVAAAAFVGPALESGNAGALWAASQRLSGVTYLDAEPA